MPTFDNNAIFYIVRHLAFKNIAGNETKQHFADIILFVINYLKANFMYNVFKISRIHTCKYINGQLMTNL